MKGADLARATFDRIAEQSLANAAANQEYVGKSVARLAQRDRVIVAANGPSLDPRRLRGYPGTLICVDGALGRLIQADAEPDLVVTADSHERIAHWFGADPDDYFGRVGERGILGENLAGIAVAIATASHPRTVAQLRKAGADLYWFNTMFDDPAAHDSLTRRLYEQNRLPCINGGGNVGTAAWALAHSILGAKTVGLVGFDFGYPPDFPVERTQYWPEIHAMRGDRWREAFTHCENGWYMDPTMRWFRDTFLTMARTAPCRTVNCSEGGTLMPSVCPNANDIEAMPLEEFLR